MGFLLSWQANEAALRVHNIVTMVIEDNFGLDSLGLDILWLFCGLLLRLLDSAITYDNANNCTINGENVAILFYCGITTCRDRRDRPRYRW